MEAPKIFSLSFICKCNGTNGTPYISKDFSVADMKETGLNGYVRDFSVYYYSIDVSNFLDIYKYLMNNSHIKQSLDLLKIMFIGLLRVCSIKIFGKSLASNFESPIKYVSLSNRPCQPRVTLGNLNFDESLFYPFTVASVSKYGESCNTIDDPYARVCVPNKVENINTKVFNLISGVNETKFLVEYHFPE